MSEIQIAFEVKASMRMFLMQPRMNLHSLLPVHVQYNTIVVTDSVNDVLRVVMFQPSEGFLQGCQIHTDNIINQ